MLAFVSRFINLFLEKKGDGRSKKRFVNQFFLNHYLPVQLIRRIVFSSALTSTCESISKHQTQFQQLQCTSTGFRQIKCPTQVTLISMFLSFIVSLQNNPQFSYLLRLSTYSVPSNICKKSRFKVLISSNQMFSSALTKIPRTN